MADTALMRTALDVLVLINTSMKVLRLYPPGSPAIKSNVEKLQQSLDDLFALAPDVVFGEAEKNLLVCGEPLSQRDQEKPQAAAFRDLLLALGIRSVHFERGLTGRELEAFLGLIARKPEQIIADGGIAACLAKEDLPHIRLDRKIYVASDEHHRLLAGLDISDEQIVRYVSQMHPDLAVQPEKILEMAARPEWLMQVFREGALQVIAQQGSLPDRQVSDNMVSLLSVLDNAAGRIDAAERENMARTIGRHLSAIDSAVTDDTFRENIRGLFGGALVQFIQNRLAGDGIKPAGAGEGTVFEGLEEGGPSGDGLDGAQANAPLSERFACFLHEETSSLLDVQLAAVLPKLFARFSERDDTETLRMIIDRLVANLKGTDGKAGERAAGALSEILAAMPEEQRREIATAHAGALSSWLNREASGDGPGREIGEALGDVIRTCIEEGRYDEALPLVQTLRERPADDPAGEGEGHPRPGEQLRALASPENLDRLCRAWEKNDLQGDKAGGLLVAFGEAGLERLLDLLRDHPDSGARVRLMQLILKGGEEALPLIRKRVELDEPWFYLRNLAYLLGRIEGSFSAAPYRLLLGHSDGRVRTEALKSLQRTSGQAAGSLLLSVLAQAEGAFALQVIAALGEIRCAAAVPRLLEMLGDHPLIYSAARTELEEALCLALGAIGDGAAVPALAEIGEGGSFFTLRSCPARVKQAARSALAQLRR